MFADCCCESDNAFAETLVCLFILSTVLCWFSSPANLLTLPISSGFCFPFIYHAQSSQFPMLMKHRNRAKNTQKRRKKKYPQITSNANNMPGIKGMLAPSCGLFQSARFCRFSAYLCKCNVHMVYCIKPWISQLWTKRCNSKIAVRVIVGKPSGLQLFCFAHSVCLD